jgi:hypothetical protein
MTLRDDDLVTWLDACEQIRRLASGYAVAMGHHDVDALADLFVDDVRVGRDETGREALRDDFARQLEPLGMTILHVTNHLIDVESADVATGVVGTRAELELDGRLVVQMIEYHDSYACRAGEWLFVRRCHRLWYGAPIGVDPLTLPPANWPENAIGLGDLP